METTTFSVTAEELKTMSIREIARLIKKNWLNVYFGAVPYLSAMYDLENINNMYMFDSGRSIVAYFLGNAATWKGESAKLIKAELNRRLKSR